MLIVLTNQWNYITLWILSIPINAWANSWLQKYIDSVVERWLLARNCDYWTNRIRCSYDNNPFSDIGSELNSVQPEYMLCVHGTTKTMNNNIKKILYLCFQAIFLNLFVQPMKAHACNSHSGRRSNNAFLCPFQAPQVWATAKHTGRIWQFHSAAIIRRRSCWSSALARIQFRCFPRRRLPSVKSSCVRSVRAVTDVMQSSWP